MKAKFRKLITFAKWAGPLMGFAYWVGVYMGGLAKLMALLG